MRRRGAPSAASSSRTRQWAARGRAEGAAASKHCLTRIEDWRAAGEVHGEFFREIRPVNTTMQVTRFVDPDWLVEVEVDAVVSA